MKTKYLLFLFIVVFFSCIISGNTSDIISLKKFTKKFENSRAEIFSVNGNYEYTYLYYVNNENGNFLDNPQVTEKTFIEYYFNNDVIKYREYLDKDFKQFLGETFWEKGIVKFYTFENGNTLRGQIGVQRTNNRWVSIPSPPQSGGLISELKEADALGRDPFRDVYLRLNDLLSACQKGLQDFHATSINYNNEDCYLIEMRGTGDDSAIKKVASVQNIDPRLLDPYSNPEAVKKIWVSKNSLKPLKYEKYWAEKLLNVITIEYQQLHGVDINKIYNIPLEIIVKDYSFQFPEKLTSQITVNFLGQWEVNKKYPKGTLKLEFPPGTIVRDQIKGETYTVK
jgi:hypothetical protein